MHRHFFFKLALGGRIAQQLERKPAKCHFSPLYTQYAIYMYEGSEHTTLTLPNAARGALL